MNRQALNPFLPSWEYVPDGEPHEFGDRVYVYGSHDAFGAPIFCVNDYVCWSAPVDDLSDWRYEGIIYQKTQDPGNPLGIRSLYAPDVTRGPDGRYYLYYAFDFLGQIGVAVCDTPAGKYEFYGKIHHKNGRILGKKRGEQFPFDPGVLTDDDGRVWLYSGFATKVPFVASRGHNLRNDGGVVMELEADMLTIKQEPKVIFPRKGKPGAFPGHAFFEASSIRNVDGKYCFVYSSENNHDLCYAMSDRPDGGFQYGGVLVDLGDLYLEGNTDETHAKNYLGNTHGGLLNIGEDWYIFYHRQTNRSSYARQACAEKLERTPDGGFKQAEVTSCGLNGGPLPGKGKYEARIACNLWSKEGTGRYDCPNPRRKFLVHPYFTQTGRDRECDGDQYIANMRDGSVAGFKYFEMCDASEVQITLRGEAAGVMQVSNSESFNTLCASIEVTLNRQTAVFGGTLKTEQGKCAFYFRFVGKGFVDFLSFELK